MNSQRCNLWKEIKKMMRHALFVGREVHVLAHFSNLADSGGEKNEQIIGALKHKANDERLSWWKFSLYFYTWT